MRTGGRPRPRPTQTQPASSSTRNQPRDGSGRAPQSRMNQKVKHFAGKCPPFNDHPRWICDPYEKKVYMYGGERPGKPYVPTSDLFCCDMMDKRMKWKDLKVRLLSYDLWTISRFVNFLSIVQKSLKFRNPMSPFSQEELQRKQKPLPVLGLSACTLFRWHETSMLLLFGGYDNDAEEASSQIIVVDVTHSEWWFLTIEGEPVEGRIDPAIVAIDHKLFVFGGYRRYGRDPQPHRSYSIASLSDTGKWTWEARDVAYTNIIPQGHIFGAAVPMYNNTKILLTIGRTTGDEVSNTALLHHLMADLTYRNSRLHQITYFYSTSNRICSSMSMLEAIFLNKSTGIMCSRWIPHVLQLHPTHQRQSPRCSFARGFLQMKKTSFPNSGVCTHRLRIELPVSASDKQSSNSTRIFRVLLKLMIGLCFLDGNQTTMSQMMGEWT